CRIAKQPGIFLELLETALEHEQLDSETQAALIERLDHTLPRQRSRQLVNDVREALAQQPLERKVQIELSALLSLLSEARDRPNLTDEFDLAISALLKDATPEDGRADNLRFAQELRRKLETKLQKNPLPLFAMAQADGSPHNRLLSGLSWFFGIFILLPFGISALFFLTGVTQQYQQITQLRKQLETAEQRVERASQRVGFLQRQVGTAGEALGRVQLRQLLPTEPLQTEQPQAEPPQPEQPQTESALFPTSLLGQQQFWLSQLENCDISASTTTACTVNAPPEYVEAELTPQAMLAEVRQVSTNLQERLLKQSSTLTAVREAITTALLEDGDGASESTGESLETEGNASAAEDATAAEEGQNSGPNTLATALSETELAALENALTTSTIWGSLQAEERRQILRAIRRPSRLQRIDELFEVIQQSFNTVDIPLILVVMATGALGSFVSVIVRADEFVTKQSVNQLDLFYIGFFRPLVGMTFAFFLVALLESGLFVNFLSTSEIKPSQKIYLYITISFVAGFSERLVRDIMGKTEQFVGARRDEL
ncbi:MAG: hypothetical protein F6K04_04910, partial [Leptolyngbya sp. SIO4C5]|nr:hypothetical protein [Leptolyngbya sp. SIO4C5]